MNDLVPKDSAELQKLQDSLVAEQENEFDNADLVLPILKIGQPLTGEVTSGSAKPGEFINSLTGETLGSEVEFIVSTFQKGRFYADDEGRTFVAIGSTIPQSWATAVGEAFVGTPFSEYPDAEEQYRARANRGEIEWGSGPPISTTYNFTGYVAGNEVPVRLSLMRTATPVARKWQTLLRVNRGRPAWDQVFNLTTVTKENTKGRGTYYIPEVKAGRKATDEEKLAALELTMAVRNQRVVAAGDPTDGAIDGSAVEKPAKDESAIEV